MPGKRSLLFYGELPPVAVNGIAISNMINLRMLEDDFEIDILQEKTTLNDRGSNVKGKLLDRISEHYAIMRKTFRRNVDFFYLTFSISYMGALKTLFSIMCFRLFSNGKVILHIHRGDFIDWYRRSVISRLLASIVIKLTTKVIVLSDIQKTVFCKHFAKPVFVLHNTVECEYNYSFNEKSNNRFVYISNYLEEKGIIDLLEVFKKLLVKYPGMSLNTYGAFPSDEMKKIILKFGNEKILIGDVITGKEKFDKISQSDCLILPSFNEGEPIVLLEAMSVGTPIIATSVGLIPEMLGADYPFYSSPADQASLEAKIVEFMSCPDRNAISRKLKERYSTYYSNKVHKTNLISIFD
jgi:glycosyltransferase involved in cell wall biosynthesis